MLSCKDVTDRACALIDEELSSREVLHIRMHLAMCKGCSRFIDQLRKTDLLTSGAALGNVGVSEEARQNVADGRLAVILSMRRAEKQQGRWSARNGRTKR